MKTNKVITESLFKLLFLLGITSPANTNAELFTILTFHRILPDKFRKDYPLPWLVTTPRELHLILYHLKKYYELGTVSGILKKWRRNKESNKPLLAITFDDGHEDNYTYAAPVLEGLGLNATFYIPAGIVEERGTLWDELLGFTSFRLYQKKIEFCCVNKFFDTNILKYSSPVDAASNIINMCKSLPNKDRVELINRCADRSYIPNWSKMMSWEQISKLAKNGHEIGSHSMTHSILINCSDRELHSEIFESRELIQSKIKSHVFTFCYPSGTYDNRILEYTEKAGYKCAVTTECRSNKKKDALFSLGRCDINSQKLLNHCGKFSSYRLSWRLSGINRVICQVASVVSHK